MVVNDGVVFSNTTLVLGLQLQMIQIKQNYSQKILHLRPTKLLMEWTSVSFAMSLSALVAHQLKLQLDNSHVTS